MKTTADRSSTSTASHVHASNNPFLSKSGGGDFFSSHVQTKLTVNAPGDKFEQEADKSAAKVMQGDKAGGKQGDKATGPQGEKKEEPKIQKQADKAGGKGQEAGAEKKEEPKIQKQEKKEEPAVQKKESSGSSSSGGLAGATQSAIVNKASGGGQPLGADTKSFMESGFGADFSNVRVHTDPEAAGLSNRLSARAFTYKNNIFFSKDQYQPGTSEGKTLLAHELTHTIQQGASVQRSAQVSTTTTPPPVQRLGISDALDYFADAAYNIPGYRMLTIIIGFNPINMSSTDRSAANILRALIEFMPGGHLISQALDNHGVFNKAGAWVEEQLSALGDIGASIISGLDSFLDSLSWSDIFDLGGVWDRAKRIFTGPVDRLISFAVGLVTGLMQLVREAILRPLAALAEGTAGYDLLKAVLGQDPITGDPVPRTPETLIGGFMKLIGRADIWENIQKGNAIARAWEWFQGALSGLMALVTSIPGRIMDTIRSITWQDVVTIVGVFTKVTRALGSFISDFMSWAAAQVISLLEIIFTVVAPGAVPYIKKAAGAFNAILENPIGFVGNLVRAGKQGFQMFASNIVNHLKTALIKWITGPLGEAGVYIPKSFDLFEIIKLVLSVLGLTWQNIRGKLVKIIPEPVLVVIEKTASILVTLVRDGPAAAWDQIKEELNEMKGALIAQVTQLIATEVVKAAVVKLVSMLNPAGAVIQAIIAIYNTITFFIEKINQIAAVVGSFINSIAAIANGQVDAAASKVEQTMANTLTVIIAFLAKFAGLGGIPQKIVGIINKIRKPIDKGLDKIVAWLGNTLKKLGAAAKAKVAKALNWWTKKVPASGGGQSHTITFKGSGPSAKVVVESTPTPPGAFLAKLAKDNSVKPADSQTEIAAATAKETEIAGQQTKLVEIEKKVALGAPSAEADTEGAKLDTMLAALATIIKGALEKWNINNKKITGVSIPRGSFTHTAKTNIAAQEKDKSKLKKNKAGELISVAKNYDRRHVVSSNDISTHYENSLNGKLVTEGKVLIEKRGSVGEAHTPVGEPLDEKTIQSAAQSRYQKFFGYAKNIFIGDSSENRSIQQHLDDGHPELVGPKLQNHVDHIKRGWALDSGFAPTPVKPV